MAISCGGKTANSSPLPTLADNCRKRAYFSEDQELLEVARPRKKSSKDSAVRPVVGSHVQEASKKRQREETVDSQDAEFQTEKETPAGDDLCSFNSFQYWRVPLPELDMSLLQADGDTGEPSGEPAKDSSVLSEMDAMET
ncbi:hypothetical protein JZ751_018923 [Albula glossodonta]|uniref:WW-binding domain-containing protein n=1 Tax=Albula glossodonta TaxID=121402 RepID=A0A8T2MWE0_9TELE|nr:hypothetical protein JZ751_018923 [Albula glossodonta]